MNDSKEDIKAARFGRHNGFNWILSCLKVTCFWDTVHTAKHQQPSNYHGQKKNQSAPCVLIQPLAGCWYWQKMPCSLLYLYFQLWLVGKCGIITC